MKNRSRTFSIKKTEYFFYKTILLLLALFSIVGIAGTIYKTIDVSIKSTYPLVLALLSAMMLGLFLLVFIRFLFCRIEKFAVKQHVIFASSCFTLMVLIYVVLILSYRVTPNTDSLVDIDIAKYLTMHDYVDKSTPLSFYVGIYPNNYCFILLCRTILKWFSFISDFKIFTFLYALNAMAMMLGCFFMWKTKKCWNMNVQTSFYCCLY